MKPLFETVLKHVSPPEGSPNNPLQLQISALDYSSYTGRLGVGKVKNGVIKSGQQVVVMHGDKQVSQGRINQVLGFKGLERIPVEQAEAATRHCLMVSPRGMF